MIEVYELARRAQGKLMREVELKDLDLRRLCGHANLYDALLRDLTRTKQQEDNNKMTQAIKSHLDRRQDSCPESVVIALKEMEDVDKDHLEYSNPQQQNEVDCNYDDDDDDDDVDLETNYDSDEFDEEWDGYDCEFELCRPSEFVEAVAVAMDRFGLEKQDVEKDPKWKFRTGGREVLDFRWKSPAASGKDSRMN